MSAAPFNPAQAKEMTQENEMEKVISAIENHGINLERKVVSRLCEYDFGEIVHGYLYSGQKLIRGEKPFKTQREIDVLGVTRLTIPSNVKLQLDYSIFMRPFPFDTIEFLLVIECKYNKGRPVVLFNNDHKKDVVVKRKLDSVFRGNGPSKWHYNYLKATPNFNPDDFTLDVGTVIHHGKSIYLKNKIERSESGQTDNFVIACEEINAAMAHFCPENTINAIDKNVSQSVGILVVSDNIYIGKINSSSSDFEITPAKEGQYFYYDPPVDSISTQTPFFICGEKALPILLREIRSGISQIKDRIDIITDLANSGTLLDNYNGSSCRVAF